MQTWVEPETIIGEMITLQVLTEGGITITEATISEAAVGLAHPPGHQGAKKTTGTGGTTIIIHPEDPPIGMRVIACQQAPSDVTTFIENRKTRNGATPLKTRIDPTRCPSL